MNLFHELISNQCTACLLAVLSNISKRVGNNLKVNSSKFRSLVILLCPSLPCSFTGSHSVLNLLPDSSCLRPSHTLFFCTLPRSGLYAFLPWYLLRAAATVLQLPAWYPHQENREICRKELLS